MAGYLTAAKTVNYLFKQNENGELDIDQDVFEQLLSISKQESIVMIAIPI